MQQAIPYSNGRTWMPLSAPTGVPVVVTAFDGPSSDSRGGGGDDLLALVKENPVLVLGKKECCMCHVVRRLLLGLGVNPAVFEMEEDRNEAAVVEELKTVTPPQGLQFPAVFIGGRHVGGLDRIMAAHISGDLVPILKKAGALWL